MGELDEFVCQVDGQKSEALQLFACFEMVFILSTGNLYPPWHNSLTLVRSLWFLVFPRVSFQVRTGPIAASRASASVHHRPSADLR